jgi:hypothetical protein
VKFVVESGGSALNNCGGIVSLGPPCGGIILAQPVPVNKAKTIEKRIKQKNKRGFIKTAANITALS